MAKKIFVSASEVGSAAFCAHTISLKHEGKQTTAISQKARARGAAMHEELNKSVEDKRCYVASYLYGVDDSRTVALRQYRDDHLVNTGFGRMFVRFYYWISPSLVVVSRRHPIAGKIARFLVDAIVRRIGL